MPMVTVHDGVRGKTKRTTDKTNLKKKEKTRKEVGFGGWGLHGMLNSALQFASAWLWYLSFYIYLSNVWYKFQIYIFF